MACCIHTKNEFINILVCNFTRKKKFPHSIQIFNKILWFTLELNVAVSECKTIQITL